MSIKLSVVIITLNEDKNIRRCLESVKWASEIIIVDSGSTDNTEAICKEYNCKIIKSPWLGFGKTKQVAVSYASNDWILSIDSDEEVTPLLMKEIQDLLLTKPDYNGYRVKRISYYLGKIIKHCGWNKDYTLRLFNKQFGNFNDKPVHEYVVVSGDIGLLNHPMMHYTYPDLNSHFCKMKRYAELGADVLYQRNRMTTPAMALLRGISKFLKMYILQLGFLDGRNGFLLSINSGWGVYLKYLLLWEKNKSKSST